jgi:hypothetical protein
MSATPSAPAPPERAGAPRRPVRRRMNWVHALVVSVAAFALWLVVDAPTLQRNAQAQPLGTRRTVSLDTLGPVATLSRGLQLSHLVSVADGAIGRSGNVPGAGVPITVPPRPRVRPDAAAVPAPTAPTTTTTVTADPRPTAANPLRVLIVGDSLGLDLGSPLQNDLANTGEVLPTRDGQESTGLSRPDYYNWPAELQADIFKANPQVVVVMIGANDPQALPGPPVVSYGTPQWNAAYGQLVNQFMHLATRNGAQVIWVGQPPMQDPWRNGAMQDVNGVVAAQARLVHGVHFLSSWNLVGGPTGSFQPFVTVNGQLVNVRTTDGTHLTPQGGELLAQAVIADMRKALHIDVSG